MGFKLLTIARAAQTGEVVFDQDNQRHAVVRMVVMPSGETVHYLELLDLYDPSRPPSEICKLVWDSQFQWKIDIYELLTP